MNERTTQVIQIESREHLLSTLAEAAELEHTVMCLYLYAVFSLKQSREESVNAAELSAIGRWRQLLMDVAVQEMTHLVLVANLTTALGGTAHFYRPSFPVKPGYFPADFVLELAPFGLATLEHFIFLERPEDEPVPDNHEFQPKTDYVRTTAPGRLMAHPGEYHTVGQLYEAIEQGIERLARGLGEADLFCGSHALQVTPNDVQLDGLRLVHDKQSARAAIRTIVEQGEGARITAHSHFEKFTQMKEELQALLATNPEFIPSRPAARNPVMRKPAEPHGTVWVNEPVASSYLDIGNALYALMVRLLVQTYSMEGRETQSKKVLLDGAFALMHGVARLASLLGQIPAHSDGSDVTAGLTFDLNRHFSPFELSAERKLLGERLRDIGRAVARCQQEERNAEQARVLSEIEGMLHRVCGSLMVEQS